MQLMDSVFDKQNALYSVQKIRTIEANACLTCSESDLMQKAGEAAFQAIVARYPDRKRPWTVVCGNGNNGGDGRVIARLARQHGYCIQDDISKQGLIIDALLGIGLKGMLRAPEKDMIDCMNASGSDIVSIDIPSGLCADTGMPQGGAVQATMTVTFIGQKQGLYLGESKQYRGELVFAPLDLAETCFTVSPDYYLIQRKVFSSRPVLSHKGLFGHVVVVGGDHGYGGAVLLAAQGALRAGAGKVSILTRPDHVPMTLSQPECMIHGVSDHLDLEALCPSVIVLGPGLGQSDWSYSLYEEAMACPVPKVIDADGLNCLSQMPISLSPDTVLTPHPGEAGRLLSTSSREIQRDRRAALFRLQEKYNCTCVLKGAGTLVLSKARIPSLCIAGNSGMASPGMGDVLSGVIGGLMAQGFAVNDSAEQGVLAHSLAADGLADEFGERGLLATDLLQSIRRLLN